MPAHYPAIQAQLIADFRDVLGGDIEIVFGSARREIINRPHVMVKTDVSREFEGIRRVNEAYTFNIQVHLPIPDPPPEYGDEAFLMEQAEYMIDKLSPHDHTTMPTPAGQYADVGSVRSCTRPQVVDTTDQDGFIAFSFQFYLETTVYQ